VASAFTPGVAIISGGIAVLAGVAVVAVTMPELWRYRQQAGRHTRADVAEAAAEL
jgi:hypothetical protein